jgi:hypothetical protein
MTKKEYIAPALEVEVVDNIQLLSGSVTIEQADGLFDDEFHSRGLSYDFDEEFEY